MEHQRTSVRRYEGKHAVQHFQRHAAYMAKHGWTADVVTQQDHLVIVTYHQATTPWANVPPAEERAPSQQPYV